MQYVIGKVLRGGGNVENYGVFFYKRKRANKEIGELGGSGSVIKGGPPPRGHRTETKLHYAKKKKKKTFRLENGFRFCHLNKSPSPPDRTKKRIPSSA